MFTILPRRGLKFVGRDLACSGVKPPAIFRGIELLVRSRRHANPPPLHNQESFVFRAAGLSGRGGSSYTDSVILRDRDNTSGICQVSAIGNRLGYAGYHFDPATQQYHVRHRVYVPELGRWTRRDPLGYVDGSSVYEYGRLLPQNALDPFGTTACFPVSNGVVPVPNGCGTSGFGGLIIPDNPPGAGGVSFTTCCDAHDVDYSTCGMSKLQADVSFYTCLRNACLTTPTNAIEQAACLTYAQRYFEAVMAFGLSAYNEAQQAHCRCCPNYLDEWDVDCWGRLQKDNPTIVPVY